MAWYSKKRNYMSLSAAETEYITAGIFCTQLLWIKQMLNDYGIVQMKLVMYCDNTNAISTMKKTMQHGKTEHIDIKHYFIRELVYQGIVDVEYATTQKQLAEIVAKWSSARLQGIYMIE